jgi:tetratricopeptide (TPR) repeat protein
MIGSADTAAQSRMPCGRDHPDSGASSIYAAAAMLVSDLGRVYDASVLSLLFLDAVAWAVPVIAFVAGAVALATALINRQTAQAAARAQQLADAAAALPEHEPEVRLPTRLAHFVDRVDAIQEAVDHLRAGERIVAIQGDGGVGKSAVMNELAHRLCVGEGTDMHGLSGYDFIYIGGGNRCPTLADVCREITLKIGEQSLSSVADDAKLAAVWKYAAQQKTVLVLDDVAVSSDPPIDPPAGSLYELLHKLPVGLVVIASVNGPHLLGAGTRVLLRELDARHAMELIGHETRRWGLGDAGLFDDALQPRLEQVVGGNPRLIESFVRTLSQSTQPVDDLLAALERSDGARQLLVPSWEQLTDDARAVLSTCAYLRGEATVDQLVIGCATERDRALAALADLLQARLLTIVRSSGRPDVYTCSRGVQRAALAETGTEAIAAYTGRLSEFYIRQLVREPENAQWAVPHIAAIKAVLQWNFDLRDDANLQALFGSILDVLFTLGLFDDRIVTGRLAYESAVRAENHRSASLATDVLSSTHAARGELQEALEAVALGQLAAERSQDAGERARQMRAHGLALYKSCDAAGALEAMRGADGLARQTGDLEILVNVQGLRAVAHLYLGAVDEAEAAARSGLAVCEEMGWERAKAYPLRNLAEVAIHRGDFDQARRYLEEARSMAIAFADRRQATRVRLTSVRLRFFSDQLEVAMEEAVLVERDAVSLGLVPEQHELQALRRAAARAQRLAPVRRYYASRRPLRFADAPIGGD